MTTSNFQHSAQAETTDKATYEAPTCHVLELELESPVLTASSNWFEDGGSYDRGFFF